LPELLEELESLDDPPEEVPAEWADVLFVDEADECVEPGSVAATAPATATLAKLTAAVVAFSRRRPRSRSATAREMARALP
jgi:hypothetical protein